MKYTSSNLSHFVVRTKPDKDTDKDLINIFINQEYIPKYMSTHLHAVKNILESGLPT